jgi:hypothetical protein
MRRIVIEVRLWRFQETGTTVESRLTTVMEATDTEQVRLMLGSMKNEACKVDARSVNGITHYV